MSEITIVVSRAYAALVAALVALQRAEPGVFLQAYMQDLEKWDRATVEEWGDEQAFAWCVRERGTHIFHPDAVDGVGSAVWEWVKTVEFCWSHERREWFWWGGKGDMRLRRLRGGGQSAQRELKGACTRVDQCRGKPAPNMWYGGL